MNKNEKGFTLVELLAVIVILGLLMAIAIPSVTKYITQSRIKTLVSTMDSYVTSVITQVNDGEYKFSDSTKVYAIPIECIELEKGGQSPFGNWMQANESYWAYVLVHYDNVSYSYQYGFTFKDDAGYGLYPTLNSEISNDMVKTGYSDLNQPKDGLAKDFVPLNKWQGFGNITNTTRLVVLESESDGVKGDGKNTCTLCQKADNYQQVEENKNKVVVKEFQLWFRDRGYVTFQFEAGMTFRDWVNSDYNTEGLWIHGNDWILADRGSYTETYAFKIVYDCPVVWDLENKYLFNDDVDADDIILEQSPYYLTDFGELGLSYAETDIYKFDYWIFMENDREITFIKNG